jgi:hypothetical protein
VVLQPNVSTLVVPANSARKRLTVVQDCPTGTAYVWIAEGCAAAVDKGFGPMTSFGSSITWNGVFGLYLGAIYAISSGGPVTLCWQEGW